MKIAERALFEFAISRNSFKEVEARGDLQWAYDVLDHWLVCVSESDEPCGDQQNLNAIESDSFSVILPCNTSIALKVELPKKILCEIFC